MRNRIGCDLGGNLNLKSRSAVGVITLALKDCDLHHFQLRDPMVMF